MEKISVSSVCPITLDAYRDPVLAGDGHIYEWTVIVRWIQQKGTSPLTREPLNVKDLRSFVFRHDRSYWCLDNVSVVDISLQKELIINGHFENNPSNGFFRCNSYGNSSKTLVLTSPHGQRSFCDGTVGLPDYLSQRLDTKVGKVYRVPFWLENMGDASNSDHVIMSY